MSKYRLVLCNRDTGEVTFAGVNPRKNAPCPICGKPDWCLIDAERGLTICQRVESPHKIGEAGWLHGRTRPSEARWIVRPGSQPEQAEIDWEAVHARCMDNLGELGNRNALAVEALAEQVGIDSDCLQCLEVGCLPDRLCWTFPMRDEHGRIIGMRTRTIDGRKFAIPGSRNGLFIPIAVEDGRGPLFIEEGPTSTAAVLQMGFDCIGRPSCSACVDMTVRWCRAHKREIGIIANADSAKVHGSEVHYPGQEYAKILASALVDNGLSVKVLLPLKGKDSRDWLILGGTRFQLRSAYQSTGYHVVAVKASTPSDPHERHFTKSLSSAQVHPGRVMDTKEVAQP